MKTQLRFGMVALLVGLVLAQVALCETVMVPMRDGTKLATDILLPSSGGPAFPVVLVRTVYNKSPYGKDIRSMS